MNAPPDPSVVSALTLSPAGAARRDRMLESLLKEVQVVRRSRVRRRRAAAALVLVLVGAAAVLAIEGVARTAVRPPAGGATVERTTPPAPPPPAPTLRIELVGTDPDILDRWRAEPAFTAEPMDDAELLEVLRREGLTCGIVRVAGKASLTCDLPLPADRQGALPSSPEAPVHAAATRRQRDPERS